MEQFYYILKDFPLSLFLKQKIISYCLNKNSSFLKNIIGEQFYEFSKIRASKFISEEIELKNLMDSFAYRPKDILLATYPEGAISIKHFDPHRNSVIWIPLYPHNGNYPPLEFYNNEEDKDPIVTCGSNNEVLLFNSKQYHGCTTITKTIRINIQISFNENYTILLDLAKRNKLIVNNI